MHTEAFTHNSFYTKKMTQKGFYTPIFTQKNFDTEKILHKEPLHTEPYTEKILHRKTFTHRSFYAQELLHTDAFTHRCTQKPLHTTASTQKKWHRKAFTHKGFYTSIFTQKNFDTEKILHKEPLHTEPYTEKKLHRKLLHTEAFTHRSFYTENFLHRRLCTQMLLRTDAQQNLYTEKRLESRCTEHLHTEPFIHKFFTQKLSHGNLYTELLHTGISQPKSLYTPTPVHERIDTGKIWHSFHSSAIACLSTDPSSPRLAPTPSAQVRTGPHSQARSCPLVSPRPTSTHFHAVRPHSSAQLCSLMSTGLFSPLISFHSLAPTPHTRRCSYACPLISPPHPFPSIPLCLHLYTHPHLRSLISTEPFSPPIYPHFLLPAPPHSSRSRARSCPLVSSPHKLPSVPLPPHRPQWFAQLRLLMSTGIFPTHPFPFIPLQQHHPHSSALVRASTLADLHPTFFSPRHFPSIHLSPHRPHSSATLAHWSLRPTHFPPFPWTNTVSTRLRSYACSCPLVSSPHPFPSIPLRPHRPQSSAQLRSVSCPLVSSPHPFPTTRLHPHRSQSSVQLRSLMSIVVSSPRPFLSIPLCTHIVRTRPCSYARSLIVHWSLLRTLFLSRSCSSAHLRSLLSTEPFSHFPSSILRTRPRLISTDPFSPPISFDPLAKPSALVGHSSAQLHSLMSFGFFFLLISLHSLAPTQFALVRTSTFAYLHRAFLSAISLHFLQATPFALFRASTHADLHRAFLPPISGHSLRPHCPDSSAHIRSLVSTGLFPSSAQLRSLISTEPFPEPISHYSLAPTPSTLVRTSTLADLHKAFLPTHFLPFHCNNTVRTPPRSYARWSPPSISPHPFPSIPLRQRRPHPSAQLRSLISTKPFSTPISFHSTVRTPPHSYARWSPPSISPHPFPSIPLRQRRPHPSAQLRSLMSTGLFTPLMRSIPLQQHRPHSSAHLRSLISTEPLSPTHFLPFHCNNTVRAPPRSYARWSPPSLSPHPFPSIPLRQHRPHSSAHYARSCPLVFSPHSLPSFSSHPFPSFTFSCARPVRTRPLQLYSSNPTRLAD